MMARKLFVHAVAPSFLFLCFISAHAQDAKHMDLTGKWMLRTQLEKGGEEVSTLDLTESGSLVLGTLTLPAGKPLTISDGYLVGKAIKMSAVGSRGPFSKVVVISGQVEGDRIIVNVKKGSGSTLSGVAERVPANHP